MIPFLNKHKYLIFLAIIWAIGLSLRLYQLPNHIWNQAGYDESRDMLVANHIFQYRENIQRGPLAAGGLNFLQNSPVYYYLITVLWIIFPEPTKFMYLWAFLMSSQIIVAYLLGQELGDKTTGIIAAIVFAIQSQLIYQSQELLQPHLLPLFSTLLLLIFIKSVRHKKLLYIYWSIFLLFFPLHIHYGSLLLIPAGLFWIIYFWANVLENKITIKNTIGPILTMVGMIALWLLLTYKLILFDQLFFFEKIVKSLFQKHTLKIRPFLIVIENMLSSYVSFKEIFVIFILAVILAYLWLKKTFPQTGTKKWLIIMSFIISTFGGLLFPGTLSVTYLQILLPFYLIIFSLGIRYVISIHRFTGFILSIFIFYLFYVPTRNLLIFNNQEKSFAQQNLEIAQHIYQINLNANEQLKTNFGITLLNTTESLPFDGWGTSGIWLYLEKISQQKLVSLHNYGVNHSPNSINVKRIYFICDHRDLNTQEIIDKTCLNRFRSHRNYLTQKSSIVFHNKNYTVWEFAVNPNIKIQDYFKVYNEILN